MAFKFSLRRVTVRSSQDVTVRAKYAVFATGYEVNQLLPELPIALHSSFALLTQPISVLAQRYPNGMLFWDYADPYIYGRTTDDLRLLIGGNDEPYRDPLRRGRALPAKTRALLATRVVSSRSDSVETESPTAPWERSTSQMHCRTGSPTRAAHLPARTTHRPTS